MDNAICPVCKLPNIKVQDIWNNDTKKYYCKQCGEFKISETADIMLSSKKADPKLSFALRTLFDKGEKKVITSTNIDEIKNSVKYPKKLQERVDLILLYLYGHPTEESRGFDISPGNIYRFGIEDRNIMRRILDYAEEKNLITIKPRFADGSGIVYLSAKGIDRVEYLINKKDNIDNTKDSIMESKELNKICLLVHGHNNSLKNEVARFIEKVLEIEVIILHEKPSMSRTIIEKIEAHSEVDFAVCLYTADDLGCEKKEEIELKDLSYRARQNVIFEAGYFMGKLGRNKVFILLEDTLEKPADIDGVIYIPIKGEWKEDLRREVNEIYK